MGVWGDDNVRCAFAFFGSAAHSFVSCVLAESKGVSFCGWRMREALGGEYNALFIFAVPLRHVLFLFLKATAKSSFEKSTDIKDCLT